MRDIHTHILPGVDDGAATLEESLSMLEAARRAGVTSIVCTPHCNRRYFDFDAMWAAYGLLVSHADGFPLQMGFEVNHAMFMHLGMEWAGKLHFDGSNEFLLEFEPHATAWDFENYKSTIFELQARGYEVIIAHPERYDAIKEDMGIARDLVRTGCKLQLSADFVAGGRYGTEKKPAKKMLEEGLVSMIASDAHHAGHYERLSEALRKYCARGAHARV